jgi:hypothetical protein
MPSHEDNGQHPRADNMPLHRLVLELNLATIAREEFVKLRSQ